MKGLLCILLFFLVGWVVGVHSWYFVVIALTIGLIVMMFMSLSKSRLDDIAVCIVVLLPTLIGLLLGSSNYGS